MATLLINVNKLMSCIIDHVDVYIINYCMFARIVCNLLKGRQMGHYVMVSL